MGGHPHWSGKAPAEPGRSGFRDAPAAPQGQAHGRSRSGLVAFAALLTVALGTVVTVIATSSVQAMAEATAFSDPKSDGWVGMAAVASVLVCALLGTIIVYRYTTTRRR